MDIWWLRVKTTGFYYFFFYQPLLKPSTGKQKRNVKGAIHTMVCSHPNLIENNPMLASLEAKKRLCGSSNKSTVQLLWLCDKHGVIRYLDYVKLDWTEKYPVFHHFGTDLAVLYLHMHHDPSQIFLLLGPFHFNDKIVFLLWLAPWGGTLCYNWLPQWARAHPGLPTLSCKERVFFFHNL